jgi:DNA adenine methylase
MFLSDYNEDMVILWDAVLAGWQAPTTLTEDDYLALRGQESSALRTFAAVGCSFGGKWFGGYARQDKRPGRRSYAARSAANLADIGADLNRCAHVYVSDRDYATLEPRSGDVVYCDPPYAGTIGYKGAGDDFDSVRFWETMDKWHANGVRVFVSEFSAPKHWVAIWGKDRDHSMHGDRSKNAAVDMLFVHADYANGVMANAA